MSDADTQSDKPRIILPPGVTLESKDTGGEVGGAAAGGASHAGANDQSAARVAELEAQLEDKEREVLRSRAEMENVRKRIQRSAEERVKYAAEGLVRDLLVVADDLDRALRAAEESHDIEGLREGVRLVQMQLHKALGDHGVHQVPTEGMRFDPSMHEAVGVEERDDVADQTVLAAHRHGYSLHDRVVRAAQVVVSRNPAEQAAAAERAAHAPKQPVHPSAEQAVMEPEESLEQAIREVLATAHQGTLSLAQLRDALARRPAGDGSRAPLAAFEDLDPARLEAVLRAMPDVHYEGDQATLTR